MLDILERSRPLLHMRECAALLLKLLQHCCMIKANRTSMFGLAAAQALLRRLPEALAEETLAPVAERIALNVEALLDDELKTTLPPLPPPPEATDVSVSIGAPGAVGAPTDAEDAAMEDAEGAMSAPLLSEWSSYLGRSPSGRATSARSSRASIARQCVRRSRSSRAHPATAARDTWERPLMAQLLGALAPYAASNLLGSRAEPPNFRSGFWFVTKSFLAAQAPMLVCG